MRRFSGLYFPAFKLNTAIYFVNLRIQSDCWKYRIWALFHATFVMRCAFCIMWCNLLVIRCLVFIMSRTFFIMHTFHCSAHILLFNMYFPLCGAYFTYVIHLPYCAVLIFIMKPASHETFFFFYLKHVSD